MADSRCLAQRLTYSRWLSKGQNQYSAKWRWDAYWQHLANCDWTVRVRRRCGLMSNYFDHLNDIVHINMLQKGLDSLSDWSRMAVKIWVSKCQDLHLGWSNKSISYAARDIAPLNISVVKDPGITVNGYYSDCINSILSQRRIRQPVLVFTARRYASAVLAVVVCPSVRLSVCLSVRLSVCHKPVLYRNGNT